MTRKSNCFKIAFSLVSKMLTDVYFERVLASFVIFLFFLHEKMAHSVLFVLY